MEPPKEYIIIGNSNYKGWIYLFDSHTIEEANAFIKEYLSTVTWQWALTKTLKLKGYEEDHNEIKELK